MVFTASTADLGCELDPAASRCCHGLYVSLDAQAPVRKTGRNAV